jgi:hypothetical protein
MNKIYMASILMLSIISITIALLAQVDFKAASAIAHTSYIMEKHAFDKVNANTQTVLLNQLTKQN